MAKIFMDLTPVRELPEYRRLWIGSLFSSLGFQITSTAVTLEIFSFTHSTFAVGLLGFIVVLPLIIGGLYGGVIADNYDRRKVSLTASWGMWLMTLFIALQSWINLQNQWILYTLVALESLLFPINQAARGAIIPRIVPPKLLASANALNMSVGSLGMALGPLLSGLFIASIGYNYTYLVNVFALLVSIWALYKLPTVLPEHDEKTPKVRGLRSVVEGFYFVRRTPVIAMTFIIDLIAMICIQARPLIPALVLLSFGGGDLGAGVLFSAGALGAFIGVTFSGWLSAIQRRGAFLTMSYMLWGIGFVFFGAIALFLEGRSPSESLHENLLPLVCASCALAVAGWADGVGGIFRSTIIQQETPDRLRGRLQGIFIMTLAGGPNIGIGVMGLGAALFGTSMTAIIGGVICVGAIVLATYWKPALWRYPTENTLEQ
ncbi:MFS transporter [Rothia sp. CCM 9418]|uniref:MFS transporter n=1 Tax=unclassified Rothia (in: high G+C Gram-positive bacteria) TaxID=2689056 RepID=UPI003AC2DFCF